VAAASLAAVLVQLGFEPAQQLGQLIGHGCVDVLQ
jgi:hypothetical protein